MNPARQSVPTILKTAFAVLLVLLSSHRCFADEGAGEYSLADVLEQSEQIRRHKKACGPLSLARVLSLLDQPQQYAVIQSEFSTFNEDGVQLKELFDVSKKYWSDVEAVRYEDKSLQTVRYPAIALVGGGNHCVVLEGVTQEGNLRVWDPATINSMDLTEDHFRNLWTGDLFVFPSPKNAHSQLPRLLLVVLTAVNLGLGFYLIRGSRKREDAQTSSSA